MMSQTIPICNDVRSVVATGGSPYYGSSNVVRPFLKERFNQNSRLNANQQVVNDLKPHRDNNNIMVSQFIPTQQHPATTSFYRNPTRSSADNRNSLSSIGAADTDNIIDDSTTNNITSTGSDVIDTRKPFLRQSTPYERFPSSTASPESATLTSTVAAPAITTGSCSRPPASSSSIMTCSAEGQDPQQAQPLLVGVKVITDWPNRNGNISGAGPNDKRIHAGTNSNSSNNNNNSNSNNNNNGGMDRRAEDGSNRTEDDKLDIYSLNGAITIDVPSSDSEKTDYPMEKFKTFVALLILLCSFFFTTISLAIVHDRVPDRSVYKPLPDTFLDVIEAKDWALSVSEVFIMITTNIMLFIVLAHRHRFIVFRRLFLLLSLLYFMRSITMFVTVLPVSSESYECSEKVSHPTFDVILLRALRLCSGLGLTINGKHTYCGDYIYSGHTTILVVGYLMIYEYSPRRFWLLHWAAWVMAFTGVLMVLVSHGHYTVDVIVAYFITTRLFWLYHTLANNAFLKERSPNNYLAREWWFTFFRYFEGNVKGPVPLEYNCPVRWPLFWSGSYRCSNS